MFLILPPIFGIGYVSEHAEIELSIKYGIHALELAMRPQDSLPPGTDHTLASHFVSPAVPLESPEPTLPWNEGPRLGWVAQAVREPTHSSGGSASAASSGSRDQQS